MSDDSHRRTNRTTYLTPYGRGNTANLDSLSYQYSICPAERRWNNFVEITTAKRPTFDRSFRRLSDSGRSQRWLAMAGSTVSFIPLGDGQIVRRELQSGCVCIVEPDSDSGFYTLLVPLPDVRHQTAGDLE